jgi:ABC-2 type transport system ATP-binding protein
MSIATEPRRTEPASTVARDVDRTPVRLADDAHEPAHGELALRIDHVTKTFIVGRKKRRVVAVDDVTLNVERGGILGILGANGGGKSTLIRLISTLLTLDTGTITVFGYDVERNEMAVKRLINRVSVDAAFFKKLSPAENLIYAARLYGISPSSARREAIRILARLGITESRIDRPVEQMSRGMQQKVAIARALLTSPTVLLLDEPTTGLDPRSKLDVQSFIEELRTTHDATIVLTTHDMDEADRLCDYLAILDQGRVVAEGTPAELKARVAADHGLPATLHSVFMTYTGRSLDEDVEEDESEDE